MPLTRTPWLHMSSVVMSDSVSLLSSIIVAKCTFNRIGSLRLEIVAFVAAVTTGNSMTSFDWYGDILAVMPVSPPTTVQARFVMVGRDPPPVSQMNLSCVAVVVRFGLCSDGKRRTELKQMETCLFKLLVLLDALVFFAGGEVRDLVRHAGPGFGFEGFIANGGNLSLKRCFGWMFGL